MKKLIFFLCCILIATLGFVTFSSCGGDDMLKTWSKTEIEQIASENASSVYFDLVNPQFTNVSDVADYQDTMIEGYSIDSVFKGLPPSVLKRVADVCINKSGSTDRRQIVKEYIKNMSVYANMSREDPANEVKKTDSATNSGGSDVTKKDGVFETSYSYYTDTINGDPVKVQVKTEKSYVQRP